MWTSVGVLFAGDGAVRYAPIIQTALGPRGRIVTPVPVLAGVMAELAERAASVAWPARRTRCGRCMSGGRTRSLPRPCARGADAIGIVRARWWSGVIEPLGGLADLEGVLEVDVAVVHAPMDPGDVPNPSS